MAEDMLIEVEELDAQLYNFFGLIDNADQAAARLGNDRARHAINQMISSFRMLIIVRFPEVDEAFSQVLRSTFEAFDALRQFANSSPTKAPIRLQAFRNGFENLMQSLQELKTELAVAGEAIGDRSLNVPPPRDGAEILATLPALPAE